MKKDLAPIVLFVYNRPEHTKKTVEGLLKNPEATDSVLYIFADGPKKNISNEGLNNLKATREYIRTIKGFKEIHIDESPVNRGLAPATIRGCSMVLNKHGKMVFVEDDDVPTPYFLSYINECLIKYADDPKVWSVCAFMDQKAIPATNIGDDVFMVNRPSSWGYGTWKRCWDKIIWDIDDLRGLFRHKEVAVGFNKWGGSLHYDIMKGLLEGKNSSWSIRYHFAAYLNNACSIYPQKSLITNTGFDGTGTHCSDNPDNFKMAFYDRPVVIPEVIKFDSDRNKQYNKYFGPQKFIGKLEGFAFTHSWASFIPKILWSIKKMIKYNCN